MISNVNNLILYIMSYCMVKLAEEDNPSELTSSVERGEKPPPISKVGPPSPSTSQHRCSDLSSTSLTEVGVKAPVRWFIFRQDRRVDGDEKNPPPQIILPLPQ